MLPTPSKSHYTFNLRDLSKVFQGMLMIRQEHVTGTESLIKLWLHEEFRVFRDRLINAEDVRWFNQACADLVEEYFELTWPIEQFENILFEQHF